MRPAFQRPLQLLFFLLLIASPGFAQSPSFPQPNILREETIQGDLSLSGSQIRTVENTKLIVNGNIYLSGNARLVVRQSIIEVHHYPREEIFASDSAQLQADTTIFKTFVHSSFDGKSKIFLNNCFLINLIALTTNARAEIRNSTIFQDRFGLVQADGNSSVLIENSVVGAIGLFLPTTYAVKIDSLRPGYFEHWSAKEKISSKLGYDIVLNKTEVKDNPGYSGGFEMGWNLFASSADTLTVSNSVLNKIVISFSNEDVQFSNLATRTPTSFSRKAISLTNTVVQGQWGIFVTNGLTTLDNCRGVWIWPVGNKNTVVNNSEINETDPRHYTGTLVLNNATMTNGFEMFDSCAFRMEGNVKMIESGPLFTSDSRVTRNFEVAVIKSVDASPIAGINLVLKRLGAELWRGTTDAGGKARFDITFDAITYQQECTLSATDTAIKLKKIVSLTNSSPVVIGLEQIPNDSHWWPVVYVDQKVAASGSGTKDSPFRTIQEGVDNALGGSIVRVAQGTYREDVTLTNEILLYGAGAGISRISGNVYAFGITGAQIGGFTIKDTNTAGIHCNAATVKIMNNAIVDQPHNGIHSSHSTLTIVNNVISGNGHNGILLLDSSNAIIRNNIIISNGQAGVSNDAASTAVIKYNDVWGNQSGSYGGTLIGDASNISADAKFRPTQANDLVLQPGSPCIDAGDPSSDYNDGEDPQGLGVALWPSQGTRRNDLGVYGGSFSLGPTVPILFSPADGSINQATMLTLTWNSVPATVRYNLQVSRDLSFVSFTVNDTSLVGTSRTIGPLANTTPYHWKVRARNNLGVGEFSAVQTFTTIVAAPPAPVHASPADSARNVPVSPTLNWSAITGATSYRLQVSVNQSFASTVFDDSTITGNTRQIGPLLNNTRYYWRVNAKNGAGVGGWSATRSFTTIVAAPQAPVLVAPVDGVKDVPITLMLSWNVATFADTYRLQVSTNSNFEPLVVDDSTIAATSRLVSSLQISMKYYWRVCAINANGASAYSTVWTFTTRATTLVEKTGDIIPTDFGLSQNYPNPFNPMTTIQFALPKNHHVTLKVFDASGKQVETLVAQELEAGYFTVGWQAEVPSGVYFYRLQAGEFVETKKMILLR
ncbi:MAG: right-handed parallel beta-helix repeat-containing protein [Ignavibacteria bacterium]|nr:right-handed parallel beta-helix repeat-containing protein [Ignavibacteria bacterium]